MEFLTNDWSACFPSSTGVSEKAAPPLSCAFIALQNIINFALAFSAIVAIFLIMYAAFQYATSGGDKEKIDGARKRITYAIIGLIVIFFSFAIIALISRFIGVTTSQLGIGN